MKTVNCEGVEYLNHETIGGAALFVRHFASLYLSGEGLDIGYSKPEWQYPGSFGIEPSLDPRYDAMNLPLGVGKGGKFNYIHSSHCLEHVKENWHNVLDYWLSKLHVGGIIFLYLPHASQNYWQPRNNRKHIHSFEGPEINDYLNSLGHQSFVSGVDMNHSFTVICEKREGLNRQDIKDLAYELLHKQAEYIADQTIDAVMNGEGSSSKLKGVYDSHGDILMPGCFDKSISQSFMQEFKDESKSNRAIPVFKEVKSENVLAKQFFEQNNIDLQNKIKEYTDQLNPFNINVELESLHANINKIRQYYNLNPLDMEEFSGSFLNLIQIKYENL